MTAAGLARALGRLSSPLLLAGLVAFVAIGHGTGVGNVLAIGFDFRGTLWEPARAVLYGGQIFADPTREAIQVGNPSIYPPLFIVLAVPLGLLPFSVAAWIWTAILALAVGLALWIVGVRDWRCYAVAISSPVVLQGLFFGNLTVALVVPIAIAWRYRDRAGIAGAAVGVAVAAKLFVWPLVVWLIVTRRFKAAAVAAAMAFVLFVVPWAVIGFDGLSDYPQVLRAVNDVYAGVSLSTASFASGLGVPTSDAALVSMACGLALVVLAGWLAPRNDGERRSFAILVGACVLASPIVWQNYLALLFIPIAVTWPRLSPAWFFGYPVWLAALLPKPTAEGQEPCCRPADVPEVIWAHSHATPAWGHAGGTMAVALVVALWMAFIVRTSATRFPESRHAPQLSVPRRTLRGRG